MDPKIMRVGIIIATIIAVLGYFLIERSYYKGQEYEGEVIEKYCKTKWGQWFKATRTKKRCYLVIQLDDGKRKRVRVMGAIYPRVEEGQRVVKTKGERYPQPVGGKVQTMSLGQIKDLLQKTPAQP